MNDRFRERMNDPKVRHDVGVLGDFVRIYCDGHHADQPRRRVETDAAVLGAYGDRTPTLCEECEAHLAYAEKRRAYCWQDPKPFCAFCETHCYKADERAWQQQMMRYSGKRSWREGHMADGIRHMIEGVKYAKHARDKAKETDPARSAR